MVILELRFTAGRFHATPWGRNVNEGSVEWPPSPWRLLRALVATWKRACPEVGAETMSSVLAVLAAPPVFHLPPASVGHTRHFMPDGQAIVGSAKNRDKIFDTFVAVPPEMPVVVAWPDVNLNDEQRRTLATVVGRVPYFGRSESWCEISLGRELPPNRGYSAARPANGSADAQVVRVLAAEPWDTREAVGPGHPLTIDTGTLRNVLRRPNPPGARWILYTRAADCLEPRPRVAKNQVPLVEVVRFALDGRPLPRVTEAVAVAERARRKAICLAGASEQLDSDTLSGHFADGQPMKGHRHARYLMTCEDQDSDRLSHLTIVASGGLSGRQQHALARMEWIPWGEHGLGLILLGMTTIERASAKVPVLAKARRWRSLTPYLLARHPRRGEDSPDDQIRRELDFLLPGKTVQVFPMKSGQRPRWSEFRRWRSSGARPALAQGFGFRLEFRDLVTGPIALGYASHFGLGLFIPE